MTRKRGGGHERGTGKMHFVDCPGCGCPNMPGAQRCMYCQGELTGPSAAFKGRFYPYLHNIREFFSFQPRLEEARGVARSLLSFALSALFICGGVYFVMRGMARGGYFNWTVGTLLLIYGGAALRGAWVAFRK